MIIEARENNALREVAVIAAALSIQDPRVRPADQEKDADAAHARFITPVSDFLFFLKLWDAYHTEFEGLSSQSRRRKFCKAHFLSFQRMREWRDIHEQISLILAEEKGFEANEVEAGYDPIHQAILSGNLRNIALKKEKNLYQGAGGREVMIFPGSCQFNRAGQWIMAAEQVETTKLYARTVATIQPEWLEPLAGELCRSSFSDPHWEKRRGQVVAFEKVTLFGLVIVARRKVNFGRIRPAEAREIFIQAALVEGELKGDYDFLSHNLKLVQELQEVEDRVRRRDILVDDYTFFRFYDERLPAEVIDQQSLNRLIKSRRGYDFLAMSVEDILLHSPEAAQLEQFPETLDLGGVPIRLTYKFSPGAEDDGVTALVPVNLLSYLRQEFFQWLVPGLLLEKVIFLLKALPKSLRRHLVPIPDTAKFLLGRLIPGQGSLYAGLGRIIDESYHLRVDAGSWAMDKLPPHLKFRFCLMDSQGKVLKSGRDLKELLREKLPASRGSDQLVAGLKRQWELPAVGPEDLVLIPERLPLTSTDGELQGFLYPGYEAGEDEVVRRSLFWEEDEARKQTAIALLLLFRREFSKQLKGLKQDFILPKSHWSLVEGLGSHDRFNESLFEFILGEIFAVRDGRLITSEEFENRINQVKITGLYPMGKEVYETILSVLRERRQALDTISRYGRLAPESEASRKKFEEYRRQVSEIIPPDFLKRYGLKKISGLARYLKALSIRIERAHVAPAKDAEKAREYAVHEARIESLGNESGLSGARRKLLAEYREMVQEFKVSLFAQELKTAYPVSAKRLEEKWRQLEQTP
jgi:ATP-dependent helicase HrpA